MKYILGSIDILAVRKIFTIILVLLIAQNCIAQSEEQESSVNENLHHFIVEKVKVPLGEGEFGSFKLYVQNHIAEAPTHGESRKWTKQILVLEDGRTPEQVLKEVKSKWLYFYEGMITRGMPKSEVIQMLKGITGDSSRTGVWVLTGLPAAGYNGSTKEISHGPDVDLFTIAHESMHGWHWFEVEEPKRDKESILIMDLFTTWSNFVYHTRLNSPEKLCGIENGKKWELNYLNYGLQNNAEWLANTFSGWLNLSPEIISPNWLAIKKNAPKFELFFNKLWISGLPVEDSYAASFGEIKIKHPEYLPCDALPLVEGFSDEDSKAIWKICTNAPDKHLYAEHFNHLIRQVAPDLPGSPADHYELGFGDANHDGVIDWIGAYTGPGPKGLGNGKYLWNRQNKVGTYTFILSGKKGDNYAEYKQDPYLTIPSMANGAIAQPWFREWQGQYGSCNGAGLFSDRTEEWKAEFLKEL